MITLRTVAAAVAVLAVLTGCSTTSSGTSAPAEESAPLAAPTAADKSARQGGAPADANTPADRDVVRTARFTVVVDNTEASAATLTTITDEADGYVERIDTGSGGSGCTPEEPCTLLPDERQSPVGVTTVVLRIPAPEYDATITRIRELGEVVAVDVTADDVTGQVTDLDARIEAQRASVARVQQLMKQANNLSEVVQIEQELSDRQADLESLLAQQNRLQDAVSLATVTVALVPTGLESAVIPDDPHWWDAPKEAFTQSWQVLLVTAAALSPLLIAAAVIGGLVVWFVRRRRRTSSQWPAPQQPPVPPSA